MDVEIRYQIVLMTRNKVDSIQNPSVYNIITCHRVKTIYGYWIHEEKAKTISSKNHDGIWQLKQRITTVKQFPSSLITFMLPQAFKFQGYYLRKISWMSFAVRHNASVPIHFCLLLTIHSTIFFVDFLSKLTFSLLLSLIKNAFHLN